MWINRKLFKRDKKDQKLQQTDAYKRPNINDEYYGALRTNSYADLFTEFQFLNGDHHLPPRSSCILEPGQETINKLLFESPILSSKPHLKALINNYFDASEEASNICSHLLKSVNQIQSAHQAMHRVLFEEISTENFVSELKSFVILENPFSDQKIPTKNEFATITEKHSSLLSKLKHKSKKMARRIKLAKYFNKATLACLGLAISAATTLALLVALHTLVALFMGPIALFTLPFKPKTDLSKSKKKRLQLVKLVRTELMKRLRGQLEMAAKGTYILNRDFDTMSRLVVRLRDEVERNKAIARFWLERKGDRFETVDEVMKEIKRSQLGMRKQADELQEHVCLSLLTINRARALVIKEIVPCT